MGEPLGGLGGGGPLQPGGEAQEDRGGEEGRDSEGLRLFREQDVHGLPCGWGPARGQHCLRTYSPVRGSRPLPLARDNENFAYFSGICVISQVVENRWFYSVFQFLRYGGEVA